MFKLAEKAAQTAKKLGAEFADVRIVSELEQQFGVSKGGITSADDSETLGFGIRVLYKGAWGFAASCVLSEAEVLRCAKLAVEIARTGAAVNKVKTTLAPEPAYQDSWQTPVTIDPFSISVKEKLELLFEVDAVLRLDKRIINTGSYLNFIRRHQWYASTEGSRLEQVFTISGGAFSAYSSDGAQLQQRSYPAAHGGNAMQAGYEHIAALDLPGNAERVREEAVALLSAPDCPAGKTDLIIGGNQLALQIHESVGHASELDRVLGYEESYAGSSFATLEKLGKFRYGSKLVNLVADGTLPGGLATAGYDDDGVRMQRFHIVKNGILAGYMTNREFCARAGFNRSFGCNRADGFANIPITRINNLSLMPGEWDYNDLIAATENGIMMDNNKSWSIDQKRLNFQFGAEIGWLVKKGKITGMVRNPTYQGITPEFWGSCDAVCNTNYWKLYSVNNCGKGQPGQRAMMTHASSPARFKGVQVGVKA